MDPLKTCRLGDHQVGYNPLLWGTTGRAASHQDAEVGGGGAGAMEPAGDGPGRSTSLKCITETDEFRDRHWDLSSSVDVQNTMAQNRLVIEMNMMHLGWQYCLILTRWLCSNAVKLKVLGPTWWGMHTCMQTYTGAYKIDKIHISHTFIHIAWILFLYI